MLAHRFLTTAHVQGFAFPDHATPLTAARTCRRVLHRLADVGLVTRLRRDIGGLRAGSSSTIWMLTSTGRRLLNVVDGSGAVGRVREPGEGFVRHYLRIADVHLALVHAHRTHRFELVDVQLEPRSWRRYTAVHGGTATLKPDLYAVVTSGEFETHLWIECDLGTESTPTLITQCQQYEQYRRTGREQDRIGLFPHVVWLVPDEHRASKLRDAVAARRDLDGRLFTVATFADSMDTVAAAALADTPDSLGDQP
jgi:hypothetical protein